MPCIPPTIPALEVEESPDEVAPPVIDDTSLLMIQGCIRQYMALDDKIKLASRELSRLRKEKKTHEGKSMAFMQEHKVPHFNLNRGKLAVKTKQRKPPVTKKWLQQQLTTIEMSQGHASRIQELFHREPPLVEKTVLVLDGSS